MLLLASDDILFGTTKMDKFFGKTEISSDSERGSKSSFLLGTKPRNFAYFNFDNKNRELFVCSGSGDDGQARVAWCRICGTGLSCPTTAGFHNIYRHIANHEVWLIEAYKVLVHRCIAGFWEIQK